MMTQRIFIDAMNVIRTNLLLARFEEDRGAVAAGRELLRLVGKLAQRGSGHTEWIVVFDGPSDDNAPGDATGRVLAIFGEGRTADEIIIERVEDALAIGHEAVIISNDTDVRVEGASDMSSQEFYANLTRLAPAQKTQAPGETYEDVMQQRAAEAAANEAEATTGLIGRLVELGHLPATAMQDTRLVRELPQEIRRLREDRLTLGKFSKRLEKFFRERVNVKPDPDPQKYFLRALKTVFSKHIAAD